MSVNLLDLVKGAVGSQMGPLSGILGESEQNTNTAVNAVVPAILGGLMKKASTDDGAGQIFKTLDDHDGGILDNIGGLLGGGNHSDLLNKGGGLLDMIFGGNRSGLLGSLARIVGLGDSKIGTIMSLLAPVVMGVLGKQRRSQGLDMSGITGLLNSQKDHLAGHLPGELTDTLGLGDMFGDVNTMANNATGAVGNAAASVSGAAADAGRSVAGAAKDAGQAGGGLFRALIPLVLLGVVGFLAFNFLFPKNGVNAPAAVNLDLPEVKLPGFDTQKMGQAFGDLTQSISGVKDEASASAILPKLKEASSMLDEFDLQTIAAGPEKETVSGLFGKLIEPLKKALETAYAIPGVEAILKPVIDPFLARFEPFGL